MSTVERYLEDKHAIVTGGSRGIGAAIATALAMRGARLTLLARSVSDLQSHAAALQTLGATVAVVACSVADQASVERAFQRAEAGLGPASILVNNAGTARSATFSATSRSMWDQMIGVNLTGTYLCTMQALPSMLAAGEGRVVNIASTAG